MRTPQKVVHLHVTMAKNFITAHKSWCFWSLIALSVVLFFIPYASPRNTLNSLGAYAALAAMPVVLASLLQRRRGSIIATTLILSGLGIFNTLKNGFPWPTHIFIAWFDGGLGILIVGLTIGQFGHMRDKITQTNRQLSTTHNALVASHEELGEAHEELKMMEEEVRANNEALTEANEQLSELASKDSLTRVFNHRVAVEILDQEFARSARHARPCALLFFDLDHFKALNDGYGHPVGDAVLFELAHIAQQTLRQGDALGRWGGEEFLAILPETSREAARQMAERLRTTVAAHLFTGGGGIRLTCSIGVSVFPDHGTDRETVLSAADSAMYAAKKSGRNRVCVADDPEVQMFALQPSVTKSREELDFHGMIKALSGLLDARDGYTGAHTANVSKLAFQIAMALGMSPSEARMVEIAGQLHDIGKIGIPDAILHKPSQLTEDEWELMRSHPRIGSKIINHIPAFKACIGAIHSHHERWDGQGYPDQLMGDAIPLGARIIAVVDAFDAIVTDRPYHHAQPAHWALEEIQRCAGSQFDPHVVAALKNLLVLDPALDQAA